jgi:hypothetical protein
MGAQPGLMRAHATRPLRGPWALVHGPRSTVHGAHHLRAGRARMRDRCRSDYAPSQIWTRGTESGGRAAAPARTMGPFCSRQSPRGWRRRARLLGYRLDDIQGRGPASRVLKCQWEVGGGIGLQEGHGTRMRGAVASRRARGQEGVDRTFGGCVGSCRRLGSEPGMMGKVN